MSSPSSIRPLTFQLVCPSAGTTTLVTSTGTISAWATYGHGQRAVYALVGSPDSDPPSTPPSGAVLGTASDEHFAWTWSAVPTAVVGSNELWLWSTTNGTTYSVDAIAFTGSLTGTACTTPPS